MRGYAVYGMLQNYSCPRQSKLNSVLWRAAQPPAVKQTARVATKAPAAASNGKSTVNSTSLRSPLRYTGRLTLFGAASSDCTQRT